MNHSDDFSLADTDRIARIAARFAPERLGLKLSFEQLTAAGQDGLRRALDAGPNSDDTLDAAIERAIRREVPTAHQELVWWVAIKYEVRGATCGLTVEDLAAAGQLGLIRAASLFDPSRGFRFNTYATHWIRNTIIRHIEEDGSIIAIPVHLHQLRRQRDAGGRLTRRETANLHDAERVIGRPILRATRGTYALPDGGFDEIADHRTGKDPARVGRGLVSLVHALPEPYRSIVLSYHGLDGEKRTLESIGIASGVSKQTVLNRLNRAYALMRKEVRLSGITIEDCIAS